MKRTIDILSVAMVIIYGTLTMVAVPLHHHALEYVDTPQYHSTIISHSVECGVCTFSATSVLTETPTSVSTFDQGTDTPKIVSHNTTSITDVDPTFSRRGPPVILL